MLSVGRSHDKLIFYAKKKNPKTSYFNNRLFDTIRYFCLLSINLELFQEEALNTLFDILQLTRLCVR